MPGRGPADDAARPATAHATAGRTTVTTVDGAVRPDLERVFRTCYPRVVGVAARVLGTRDAADDVAQEVFLAFARSNVPAEEAPGWLSVAAAHTALNTIRGERRRTRREQPDPAAPQTSPDAAEVVVVAEDRRRVREAVARLPRTQAVVLVLRHSGLAYAEVAAACGLAPGSVGTTLRRAERALREELDR